MKYFRLISFLSLLAIMTSSVSAAEKPDFAFPADVARQSLADLAKARSEADGPGVIRALAHYATARNLVDNADFSAVTDTIWSAIDAEPANSVAAAMAKCLLATLYQAYYSDNQWRIGQRQSGDTAGDVALWDKAQFRDTVAGLYEQALKCPYLSQIPSSDWIGVVKGDTRYYPVLRDFVLASQAETWRMFDEPTATLNSWQSIMEGSEPGSLPWLNAKLRVMASEGARFDDYKALYEQLKRDSGDADVLACLWKEAHPLDLPQQRWLAAAVRKALTYPQQEKALATNLTRILEQLTRPEVELILPEGTAAPDTPFQAVINVFNAKRYTVKVYGLGNLDVKPPRVVRKELGLKNPLVEFEYTHAAEPPFRVTDTLEVALPRAGYYTLAVDVIGDNMNPNEALPVLMCADVCGIIMEGGVSYQPQSAHLLALNPVSGAPLAGLQATFHTFRNGVSRLPQSLGTTDKQGWAPAFPELQDYTSGIYTLAYPRSKAVSWSSQQSSPYPVVRPRSQTELSATGWTDRAVYHPGDSVQWAFVLGRQDASGKVTAVPGQQTVVKLYDANYQQVGPATSWTTDDFGRVTGISRLPLEGLTGQFHLSLSQGDTCLGDVWFEVSDYRLPDVQVADLKVQRDTPEPGEVTISGHVETYTGFPIPDASIKAMVKTLPRLRWWFGVPEKQVWTGEATTDAKGRFTVTVPGDVLKNQDSTTAFQAIFDATAPNGETRTGTVNFITGKPCTVVVGLEGAVDITTPVNVRPSILDEQYQTYRDQSIHWTLTAASDTIPVAQGDSTLADWRNLPQGRYTLMVQTADTSLSQATHVDLTLFDPSSPESALPSEALWVPITDLKAGQDGKIEILYAVGQQAPVTVFYHMVTDGGQHIYGTTEPQSSGYNHLKLSLSKTDSSASIQLFAMKDMKAYPYGLTVSVPSRIQGLVIKTSTLRDHVDAGDTEQWSVSLTDPQGNPAGAGAAMLDIYNGALDMISRHFLNRVPYANTHPRPHTNITDARQRPYQWSWAAILGHRRYPYWSPAIEFEDYGQGWGFGQTRAFMALPLLRAKSAGSELNDLKMDVASDGQIATEALSEEESTSQSKEPAQEIKYRDAEIPVMAFMPRLTTGADGKLEVSLTFPDANAQWSLNLMAWNQILLCDQLTRTITASKPLMARLNPPRYLRRGDDAAIPATVMNATDQPIDATLTLEIYDPVVGTSIQSVTDTLKLDPQGQKTTSINVKAPLEGTALMGIRIVASDRTHTDAEQWPLPILGSVSPVVESTPFWIAPGQDSLHVDLPPVPADASVTLEYCGNPRWYVVTALPGLASQTGCDANSVAARLFGASVASGLLTERPEVGKAIAAWANNPADSALVSMLQRNPELKIAMLGNTPWVTDAQAQTARMSRLALLMDPASISTTLSSDLSALSSMGFPDGGWGWLPASPQASEWTTLNVLGMLGDLHLHGWLPHDDKLSDQVRRSLIWMDRKAANHYAKSPVPGAWLRYAFIRSMWTHDVPVKGAVYGQVLHWVAKEWKQLPLGEKPAAAILMHRSGRSDIAMQILESLRQYAKSSPTLGMWFPAFDAHPSGWAMDKVMGNALSLLAFEAVAPGSPDARALAQWMVVNKAEGDWSGDAVATSQAVAAVLSSSALPLSPAPKTIITLGQDAIESTGDDSDLMGSLMIPIQAPGRQLTLMRISADGDSLPCAFGAMHYRYQANPEDVRPAGCDAVSISRRVLKRLPQDSGGYAYKPLSSTEAQVGDRLRVQIAVHVTRDLQYVVIEDPRPAAFQPVFQTSDWEWQDGLGVYRESRDAMTRMMVEYLPVGDYLLEYDVDVMTSGSFAGGVATLQSQYAPSLSSHTEGQKWTVR